MNERREHTLTSERDDTRDDMPQAEARDPAQDGHPETERPASGTGMSTGDLAAAMEHRGADSTSAATAATPPTTGATRTATGNSETQAEPLFAGDETDTFRARWSEIQTGFVDEPRQAVEQADALVAEVIQRLTLVFAEERSTLEQHWGQGDTDTADTEGLRVALRRYRSFFERLLAAWPRGWGGTGGGAPAVGSTRARTPEGASDVRSLRHCWCRRRADPIGHSAAAARSLLSGPPGTRRRSRAAGRCAAAGRTEAEAPPAARRGARERGGPRCHARRSIGSTSSSVSWWR